VISLNELSKQLSEPSKPFEQWQPAHCGQLSLLIDEQGKWFYAGSEIIRQSMVKLFASVLCNEDGQFYLKTPVEKIAIEVKDAPFIIVNWHSEPTSEGSVICCIDNLNRTWLLGRSESLYINDYKGAAVPYMQLPYGCFARVARNVFYQWAEIAETDELGYFITSAQQKFYLQ
jgi:hypothetical protein